MPTCLKCQEEFPNTIVLDQKLRNLSRRKFCLTCSPFGMHNTQNLIGSNVKFEKNGKFYKKCPSCNMILELNNDNYYIRKSQSGFHYYCKKCQDTKTRNQQQKIKEDAVKYKGGKCINCGYNKYYGALEFHHIDPLKKDFQITSYFTYNFEKIKAEIDKCILLCANCHRELHGKVISL